MPCSRMVCSELLRRGRQCSNHHLRFRRHRRRRSSIRRRQHHGPRSPADCQLGRGRGTDTNARGSTATATQCDCKWNSTNCATGRNGCSKLLRNRRRSRAEPLTRLRRRLAKGPPLGPEVVGVDLTSASAQATVLYGIFPATAACHHARRKPPRPAKATMPGETPPRPCPCPCPARALRKPAAHKPGESHQKECTQDPVPRCSTRDQPRGRKDSPGRPRPPLPRQPKPGRQQWPPFDETGKFLSPLISHHQQQYHRVYARNWACPVALRGAQR